MDPPIKPKWVFQLKFIYYEKATKFCKISTLLLSVCTIDKSKVEISQNFVAFSEYTNFTKYGSEILLFEGLGVILTFFEMTLEFDRSVLEKLHEASYVRSRSYLGMYFIPSKLMIYMHHSKHEIISGFFLHTCIHHSIFIRTVKSKLLLCSIVVHSFPSWLDWSGLWQKSVYCACCSAQTAHKQVWTGSAK